METNQNSNSAPTPPKAPFNKWALFIGGFLILGIVAYLIFFQLKTKQQTNNTTPMTPTKIVDSVNSSKLKIELINNPENKLITNQGQELLLNIFKNKTYSVKAKDTRLSWWQTVLNTNTYANINFNDEKFLLTVGTGTVPSYVLHFYKNEAGKDIIDEITFDNFDIKNFFDLDINKITEVKNTTKVSYGLELEGYNNIIQIKINGEDYTASDKTPWGGEDNFSLIIPINKLLKQGNNKIELISTPGSSETELKASLVEMRKNTVSNTVIFEPNKPTIMEFIIQENEELEIQQSIFDF